MINRNQASFRRVLICENFDAEEYNTHMIQWTDEELEKIVLLELWNKFAINVLSFIIIIHRHVSFLYINIVYKLK